MVQITPRLPPVSKNSRSVVGEPRRAIIRLPDSTTRRQSLSDPIFMRTFRTALVQFLAVFWLFATQHCALEAAGILLQQCEQEAESDGCGGAKHASDGCETVESGEYQGSAGVTKVAPPITIFFVCLLCLPAAGEEFHSLPVIHEGDIGLPLDWVPSWPFERRAALPPGAPFSSFA